MNQNSESGQGEGEGDPLPDEPSPLVTPSPVPAPPSASPDPPPPPRPPHVSPATPAAPPSTSRGLVLWWCLWLLGSWAVTLWIDSNVPAGRWMIFACLIGLMALWPALRLSQSPRPAHERELGPSAVPAIVFVEWLSLMLIVQAVVWPMRLNTGWTLEQTAWLNAALASWSLLTAAVLVIGSASRGGAGRTLAMVVCLLLLLGEPAAMALINMSRPDGTSVGWMLAISPLEAVWRMTGQATDWRSSVWQPRVIIVGAAAVAAMIAASMIVAGHARRSGESSATETPTRP